MFRRPFTTVLASHIDRISKVNLVKLPADVKMQLSSTNVTRLKTAIPIEMFQIKPVNLYQTNMRHLHVVSFSVYRCFVSSHLRLLLTTENSRLPGKANSVSWCGISLAQIGSARDVTTKHQSKINKFIHGYQRRHTRLV